MIKFKKFVKEAVPDSQADLMLVTGKTMILKQPKDDYDRGLLVTLTEEGSYEVAYWAGDPKPYPIEVLVDGQSVKEDAKIVKLKFHPKKPETD